MKNKSLANEILYEDFQYNCTVRLLKGAKVQIDYGDHGVTLDLFECVKLRNENEVRNALNGRSINPDDSWRYERYLSMLLESQKAGHDVHQEIDEALNKYKEMIGL